jgi:hypothetical protein
MLLEADKAQRLQLFGEDSCDLVLTIEQSFGVRFSEDDLVQATTIGALSHTIFTKLESPVSPRCLSAVTFYKFRAAFVEAFGVPRSAIFPTASLRQLMPWKSRKRQWRKIQYHLDYVLPQLTWTLWLVALWLLLAGLAFYFLFASRMFETFGAASLLVGIVGPISILWFTGVILSPLGRHFPRSCKTFGDLVKLGLARNYGKIAAKHGISSERDVAQLVFQLISAEIAVDVEKLSVDTYFPEGLRIY